MATYQNPEEYVYNVPTATGFYSGPASGAPITSASLTPTKPITLPQPTPDKTDYMTGIAGTAAQIAEGMKTDATTDTEQTDLQKMLASITTPSGVDAYNAAGTSLGIDTAQADALAARRAKRAAQSELAGIQGQVQAVVDRATVENLKLEQNINVGSTGLGGAGALASSSFLNVRQQEVNRQAAITALPLQALALAAQAKVASLTGEEEYAQSTLKAAQDKLDTTFKLWSDDADRKQTLQLKMLDIVIAQGNKKEKERAEALKEITTRNQSDIKDARGFAQQLSASALTNGQADIAAKLTQLTPPDPTSKTFVADLQAYNNDISKLQGKIVAKVDTSITEVGGRKVLVNNQTGEIVKDLGSTGDGGGVVTLNGKPQTTIQATANGYADRLNEANVVLTTLGDKFAGSFAYGNWLPNLAQSADRQSYEQSKRNFVTAILRRESGAAISATEFDTAEKQYFPQAGDKPETVVQKINARNTAINNIYREANVVRPVLPGDIIFSNGVKYRVGTDGETLEPI